MRVRCRLRELRGRRSIRDMAEATGVQPAYLSLLEQGRLLPSDSWRVALEQAYGAPLARWYEGHVFVSLEQPGPMLVVLEPDPEHAT